MNEPHALEPDELKVGGPVDPSGHVYIIRESDREFVELLKAGEFVNVVTSRQMGKTSLVYHAEAELEPQGYRFAYVDLSNLRTESRPLAYFQSIVKAVARELRLDLDLSAFWASRESQAVSHGFIDFFRQVVDLCEGPIIVVLDEIDTTLERDFTDDLFTAIRSIYTSRPREKTFKRLTFCLVGVATPNELIKAPRTTPYNIGRTLWLADFDPGRDNLAPMARTLSDDPETAQSLLTRVLHWTSGQPYLTAWLCSELRRQQAKAPEAVDALVESSFKSLERLHHDAHFEQTLRFISERVANSSEVMALYERVLRGRREPDQPANLAYAHLKLSGLVRRDEDGRLVPRNRIYERLFNLEWVQASKPAKTLARARRAGYAAAALLLLAVVGGGFYYQTSVVPLQQATQALQQREEARRELEKLNVTLSGDIRGFTDVGLPRQDTRSVLQRALPYLQTLSTGADPSALSFELAADPGIDLGQLAPLTGLRRLVVADPKVADLSPIAGMRSLQELDISGTAVTDLAPVAGLGSLIRLSAAHTPVSDLSPLARLSKLEVLELANTRVGDLAPLAGLSGLRQLDLANTPVRDLAPLAKLANLEELDLSRTAVTNLAPLKALPKLRHLALDGLGLRGFNTEGQQTVVLEDPPALARAGYKPGDTFRDCAECPQMVVVPAGRFVMGSPQTEEGHGKDEEPMNPVAIPEPIAVARYETRADEWALCVREGACPPLADGGFGRGARPAVLVSWDEARNYARWLSRKSGRPYRLLSEAEWEYAARAGTTTARFWGDDPDQACAYANVADETLKRTNAAPAGWKFHNCTDGYAFTAPVGSFRPNAFGLYDVLGNVWEWTEDCYHESYRGAPADGRPWVESGCDTRIPRGGAWGLDPRGARSAGRFWDLPGGRGLFLGFRLARTLP